MLKNPSSRAEQEPLPFLQLTLIEIDERQGDIQRQVAAIIHHLKKERIINRRFLVRKLQVMKDELDAINNCVWKKAMLDLRLQERFINSHSDALAAYIAEETAKWRAFSWIAKLFMFQESASILLSKVVHAWDDTRAKLHCTIAPPECWVDEQPNL